MRKYAEIIHGADEVVEDRCTVCGAVDRYCPGHDDEGRGNARGVPMMSGMGDPLRALPLGRAAMQWGRFEGDPIARWSPDGRRMILFEPFTFIDIRLKRWTAARGAILDGASIPSAFWPLVGTPFVGAYRYASVIHDYYCDTRAETWEETHTMFYYACRAGGVGKAHGKALYYAVYWFGPRWGARASGAAERPWRATELPMSRLRVIERFIKDSDPDLDGIRRTNPGVLGLSGSNNL